MLAGPASEPTARSDFRRIVAIIPARYESTRFPGKALAEIAGRPMIAHVHERAAAARSVDAVIVATDDERIARVVEGFGGEVRMTSRAHRSGTDRLAEVAQTLDCELIVNVQGDEPLLDPAMIDQAVTPFADTSVRMSTLRRRIDDPADLASPHVVKVVVDRHDNALYFSRAPIPHRRDVGSAIAGAYKHVGLYVYRRPFLLELAALPPTPLEEQEMLEQLRVLEHGFGIKAVETTADTIGVDTPADLERVRALVDAGTVRTR